MKQWHMSQIIMNLRCKGNSAKCYTMVLHKGPTQTWEELHPQGMSLPSLPMIHQQLFLGKNRKKLEGN